MRDNIKLSMLINADENRSIHANTNDGSPIYPENNAAAVNKETSDPTSGMSQTSQANDISSLEYTSKHNLTEDGESEAEKAHKKRRGRRRRLKGPPYICDYPGCGKSFQRSEHLARHKLNHNPKKIFKCTQPGCKKTFVRHDLLVRHLKRHANRLLKEREKLSEETTMESGKQMVEEANLRNTTVLQEDKSNEIATTSVERNNRASEPIDTSRAVAPAAVAPATIAPPGINDQDRMKFSVNNSANVGTGSQPLRSSRSQEFSRRSNSIRSTNSNNTKGFSSVTQILQQHNHSLADTPEPANNKDFSAPNLLNWLFSDNTSNPAVDQRLNMGVAAQTDPNDFLNGLNEFQMNNGGQSFFIPDGFDQLSPASSSNLGLYSSPNQGQRTPDSVHTGVSGSISASPSNSVTSQQNGKQAGTPSMTMNCEPMSMGKAPNEKATIDSVLNGPKRSSLSSAAGMGSNSVDADKSLFHLAPTQLDEFSSLIPEMKNHTDFQRTKLEKALRMYWKFFHPRFPMLHRPSFDSVKTPSLLLLAMIMLGIKLSQCVDDIKCPAAERFENPKDLADKIALPLRWLIFASPQFQPPARLWIIQSLLMLEFYEKNCTTRQLHERAHLHHGTTIQLLRRSPTLGGSPHKIDSGDDYATNWFKWIEIESMKRATFMCFYMDAIDAISFGHQMLIYAHQIQMTMPVQDEVWESKLRNFRTAFKRCKQPKPFLLVLKSILNGVPTRTNSFGKKVLLAGLSAIMFQIQQRDMQLMFGLDKFGMSGTVNNWRELLTAAFSIWRNDVGGSCCSSRTAIDNMSSMKNSQQFSTSDTRCKCITYHMAHVYMSISHYDLFIVAGAPWRMNVKPSSNLEREQIETRVRDWTKTRHSKVCVVQCYLLLFEVFLSPQDSSYEYQYDYLPDQDLFFRSYVIGLCTMVLWCYIHGRYGEGAYEKTKDAYVNHEYEEDGYRYLKRIRNELTRRSGGVMLHTWFSSCTGAEFYGKLVKWVNVLDDVPDKQNLVGLLDLVGNKLVDADYTVVKEIGKLLLFCRDRCRGSTDDVLMNMYE